MSNYNDPYRPSQGGSRSYPTYDNDSDYDEHTGRRYPAGSGRGWGNDNDAASNVYDGASSRTAVSAGALAVVPAARDRDGYYQSEFERGVERERDGMVMERRERRRDDDDRRSEASGRRGRGRDDRSDSESRSRSRGRGEGGLDGFKEKLEGAFDTSGRGIGVGLAGAVVGALAGRQIGKGSGSGKGKHTDRDMIIGALVGGLGANAAEQGFRTHKERRDRRDDGRYEEKWGSRSNDGGRSRSRSRGA